MNTTLQAKIVFSIFNPMTHNCTKMYVNMIIGMYL